jgi:hypothetical protein
VPTSLKEQAQVIGFTDPTIQEVPLRRGQKFTAQGVTKGGQNYKLVHEVRDFDDKTITLKIEGHIGTNKLEDIQYRFPLIANKPLKIPQFIYLGQPDIYIAFIAPSAKAFKPVAGRPLIVALGEVRDTVPPPPPK